VLETMMEGDDGGAEVEKELMLAAAAVAQEGGAGK